MVSYSVPVRGRLPSLRAEAAPVFRPRASRLDSLPHPYYKADWGFCLTHRQLERAPPRGEYEVVIDSTLEEARSPTGSACARATAKTRSSCRPTCATRRCATTTLGPGDGSRSSASCSRAPPPLFGPHRVRPRDVGAITWLARNEDGRSADPPRTRDHRVGEPGRLTYKRSRRGDATIDRAAAHFLKHAGGAHIVDFTPYGYDERQYCSPGFDLPVGCFARTPHGEYPEYHTSADDLAFVTPEKLAGVARRHPGSSTSSRATARYEPQPKGEPQLGRRGLYRTTGGSTDPARPTWRASGSSIFPTAGKPARHCRTLQDLPFATVATAARELTARQLLESAKI